MIIKQMNKVNCHKELCIISLSNMINYKKVSNRIFLWLQGKNLGEGVNKRESKRQKENLSRNLKEKCHKPKEKPIKIKRMILH